jgi:hypothetical protein
VHAVVLLELLLLLEDEHAAMVTAPTSGKAMAKERNRLLMRRNVAGARAETRARWSMP